MITVSSLAVKLICEHSAFDKGLRSSGRSVRGFGAQAANTQRRIVGFTAALAALTGAVYAVNRAVKAFAEFEKQMAEVSTMLNQQSMHYMPAYTKAIKGMSIEFGQSTSAMARGLYDILSASVAPSEALNVLRISAEAATAGLTGTGVAADAITTILNSYSMSASQAGRVSDVLFTIVKRGKTTFAELAPNIGKVSAQAAVAGVSLEQLAAVVATLTRAGLQTEIATTSMKAIINAFIKSTPPAKAAARKYGVELSSATLKAIGLTGALEKLSKASAEELGVIMANIRGYAGFAAAIKQVNWLMYDLNLMFQSGARYEAFGKMMNTTAMKLAQMKQAITILVVELGQIFVPIINTLAKLMGKLNESVRSGIVTTARYAIGIWAVVKAMKMAKTLFLVCAERLGIFSAAATTATTKTALLAKSITGVGSAAGVGFMAKGGVGFMAWLFTTISLVAQLISNVAGIGDPKWAIVPVEAEDEVENIRLKIWALRKEMEATNKLWPRMQQVAWGTLKRAFPPTAPKAWTELIFGFDPETVVDDPSTSMKQGLFGDPTHKLREEIRKNLDKLLSIKQAAHDKLAAAGVPKISLIGGEQIEAVIALGAKLKKQMAQRGMSEAAKELQNLKEALGQLNIEGAQLEIFNNVLRNTAEIIATFEKEAAAVKVIEDLADTIAGLQLEIDTFGMKKHESLLQKFRKMAKDIPVGQLKEFNLLLDQLAEKVKGLEVLEAGRELKESIEELRTIGQQITESVMTPLEKYELKITELSKLFDTFIPTGELDKFGKEIKERVIDIGTYGRAVRAARDDLENATKQAEKLSKVGEMKEFRPAFVSLAGMAINEIEKARIKYESLTMSGEGVQGELEKQTRLLGEIANEWPNKAVAGALPQEHWRTTQNIRRDVEKVAALKLDPTEQDILANYKGVLAEVGPLQQDVTQNITRAIPKIEPAEQQIRQKLWGRQVEPQMAQSSLGMQNRAEYARMSSFMPRGTYSPEQRHSLFNEYRQAKDREFGEYRQAKQDRFSDYLGRKNLSLPQARPQEPITEAPGTTEAISGVGSRFESRALELLQSMKSSLERIESQETK